MKLKIVLGDGKVDQAIGRQINKFKAVRSVRKKHNAARKKEVSTLKEHLRSVKDASFEDLAKTLANDVGSAPETA